MMISYVYTAKKSLVQLRQLYFRMKDEVFAKVKGAVSFNTPALEKILKEVFTETRCMDDESYPRCVCLLRDVLVSFRILPEMTPKINTKKSPHSPTFTSTNTFCVCANFKNSNSFPSILTFFRWAI